MIFRVSMKDAGQSVLHFLKANIPEAQSAKAIKRAIEARFCKVNGKLELFASRRLKSGDTVEFVFDAKAPCKRKHDPCTILYEDEDILAIDKPVGVVCTSQSLQRLLPQQRPLLVHRLDKDTTGVLILAKTHEAKATLEDLFATRAVHKTYLALVHGWLHEKEKTLTSFLVKDRTYEGQTIYRSVQQGKGARAITHFILRKQKATVALIQCEPVTGRTHQLRVQLSALGSPILGDPQYGRRQEDPSIVRHMLHAWKVSFPHPRTSKILTIIAPVPADFQSILTQRLGITQM